jgi:phage I-like protein
VTTAALSDWIKAHHTAGALGGEATTVYGTVRETVYGEPQALELNATDDGPVVPSKIQLLPNGQRIKGRDGREFNNPDPEHLAKMFKRRGQPLPVDIEHASEHGGFGGVMDSRAVGWIVDIQARKGGAVFASVEWTPEGENLIASKAFRFISPAFFMDESSNVREFSSAAITNHPNLRLRALNRAGGEPSTTPEVEPMDPRILIALGLAETATADDAVTALNNALNVRDLAVQKAAEPPSLAEYVPRADYVAEQNRANTAVTTLAERDAADHDKAVCAAVDAAIKSAKLTPAQREQAVKMASADLVAFGEFVSQATPVVNSNDSQSKKTESAPPESGKDASTLSPQQLEACKAAGITPETFAATPGFL